jgi:hypothetical protein
MSEFRDAVRRARGVEPEQEAERAASEPAEPDGDEDDGGEDNG